MSTTDPTVARREREARRASRRPSIALIALLLVALFAGGVGVGLGMLIAFADQPRWLEDWTVWCLPAGFLVSMGAGNAWVAAVLKRPQQIGIGYGVAAWLAGAGAGLIGAADWIVDGWVRPVGFAALLLAAVVFTVGAISTARRGRRTRRRAQSRLHGTPTAATVSDQGYRGFGESNHTLAQVTFTFTDAWGTQRWVQRLCRVQRASPIVNGQQTRIWYDAHNPGDDSAIFVELADAEGSQPGIDR